MGSSKTGSKGCWLLVNERVHRGFSSSLLLTFCMQLQCLFVTVSQCLCLRVLLCMCECEYAGGLACSKSRLSEVGEAVAGTIYILVWHRILYFLLCCQHQHPRLFHTGIWGGAMVSIMVRGSHKVNIALNVAKDTTDLSV